MLFDIVVDRKNLSFNEMNGLSLKCDRLLVERL